MANIAVRSSSKASSALATSISVSAPAGTTTGDLVIVVVACNGEISLSDNNGSTPFTLDNQQQETVNDSTFTVFSRRIIGGDPSTYTFVQSGGANRMSAVAVTFSDPNPTTIYDPAPGFARCTINSNTSSNTTKASTTTINNSIHVLAVATENMTITSIPTGSYTEQQQSINQPISFCTKTITSAGDTGTNSFGFNFSQGNISFSFGVANVSVNAYTLATTSGSYAVTGTEAVLRPGAFTYLRLRK